MSFPLPNFKNRADLLKVTTNCDFFMYCVSQKCVYSYKHMHRCDWLKSQLIEVSLIFKMHHSCIQPCWKHKILAPRLKHFTYSDPFNRTFRALFITLFCFERWIGIVLKGEKKKESLLLSRSSLLIEVFKGNILPWWQRDIVTVQADALKAFAFFRAFAQLLLWCMRVFHYKSSPIKEIIPLPTLLHNWSSDISVSSVSVYLIIIIFQKVIANIFMIVH